MKRSLTLLSVLTVSVLVLSACGGGGDGLVADGKLTVCTDSPYKPMEFEVDGEFVGFTIDLVGAIAEDLDLELVVINTGFDRITSGLVFDANDCDVAAASITILPEREENVDFTIPYFVANQSLLAKASSGLTTLADFGGRRIGVQSTTTGETYARENAPDADVVSFENPGDLITALVANEVEGVLQDIVPNAEAALDNAELAVVETYPTDESYGLALAEEGSEDLLADINDSLAEIINGDQYQTFCNTWFGNPCTIPPSS